MESSKIREKFLSFFKERNHAVVPSSSIIPSDPSCLFTTAGMQQFKPYYLGNESPYGRNAASCQKCIRTSDIDEVGDESHLTFLEMLGNFSFGGYFKKEAVQYASDFMFKEMDLPLDEAVFTVFKGEGKVPFDQESVDIWKNLGISPEKIKEFGRDDNFWGPTGEEGPCGPTTEIHIRGTEIWNLVFNEYYQDKEKNLVFLKQKGVDTGMGLERLAMVSQQKKSVFETDLFLPIIEKIGEKASQPYEDNPKAYRIIADHAKSSVFISSEGIFPSNVEKGYILRRIIRRSIRYGRILDLPKGFLMDLAGTVIDIYKSVYPELQSRKEDIITVIQKEEEKFEKTLASGLKMFEKVILKGNIPGQEAFHLYDTYGFPLELTLELAREKGVPVDEKGFKEAFLKHKEVSRAGVEKKFGGVGKDAGEQHARYHTATHLLHKALRELLGDSVKQMGSDITAQRMRFDFSHERKLTEEELKAVQDAVNNRIKEDLEVKREEMTLKEALESGALSFFKEKYPDTVSVYSIGSWSKEICAGPHAKRTGELGVFKILKEESAGSGIRRIRAVLE